jgi:hypothetical protein
LTPLFHRKRSKRSEKARCEDSAKFNAVFLATTLSHALCFWQKRRVIENFEYLGEFEEYF